MDPFVLYLVFLLIPSVSSSVEQDKSQHLQECCGNPGDISQSRSRQDFLPALQFSFIKETDGFDLLQRSGAGIKLDRKGDDLEDQDQHFQSDTEPDDLEHSQQCSQHDRHISGIGRDVYRRDQCGSDVQQGIAFRILQRMSAFVAGNRDVG